MACRKLFCAVYSNQKDSMKEEIGKHSVAWISNLIRRRNTGARRQLVQTGYAVEIKRKDQLFPISKYC
jgi:hypothetical protein